MKTTVQYIKYGLLSVLMTAFIACEDKEEDLSNDLVINLSAAPAPGQRQFRERLQSGDEVNVEVDISSRASLTGFTIAKTVNLALDPSFGDNGVLTVNPGSGTSFQYPFHYVPSVEDVDQLVGFTFKASNTNGVSQESDLTLVVTLSPRDNLTRRRWLLRSVLHVNNEEQPNKEEIKDCEKDNSMLLNEDGTMAMDYGEDTGAGDCLFDGFTVYQSWQLTEDEQFFIRKSYGIFSPDVIVTDTLKVRTLTVDRLALEEEVDLSAFGLGIETFLWIYDAVPR
jgi:hypothetical protein